MKPARLWTLVLAAGAGRRLAGMTGGVPKQYWRGPDGRTLLGATLDRTALLSPASRTVIVVDREHRAFIDDDPTLAERGDVVYQPCDKGTAAGVLLGLMPITTRDPKAIVLVTPSDHGIDRTDRFVGVVGRAVSHIQRGRCGTVLFGVRPSHAEPDYGWILPKSRRRLSGGPARVGAFVEKPGSDMARQLFDAAGLWNTMVLVARARNLATLCAAHMPILTTAIEEAWRVGEDRVQALEAAYATVRPHDFSRDVLTHAADLFMQTWPSSLGWTDLGTPERWRAWHAGRRNGSSGLDRIGQLRPLGVQ